MEEKYDVILERLTVCIEHLERDTADHEERLRRMENQKSQSYDWIRNAVMSALISGIVAFLFITLGLK